MGDEIKVGKLIAKLISESPLLVEIYQDSVLICEYTESDTSKKKTLSWTNEGRNSPYNLSDLAELLLEVRDPGK